MIIIGHPWIDSPVFCKIYSIEEIKKTQPNQVVLLEPLKKSHDIARYCQQHSVSFSVMVNTLEDALYANALGASYILCEAEDASTIQPIANEYLFDTRLLVAIDSKKEMVKMAQIGIDGVIYQTAIH